MSDFNDRRQRDFTLDYVRTIAMAMIVFCHFFQILGHNNLALWLSTGVQIFLILSAKLMCGKVFKNKKQVAGFYISKLFRIMLPIWIYLIFICLALIVIKYPLSAKSVIVYALGGAAFIKGGVLGLGHFWYISIILIAYILVPILALFSDRVKKLNTLLFIIISAAITLVFTGVFYLIGNASYGVNLALFVVSYYVFQRNEGTEHFEAKALKCILLPTVVLVVAHVLLERFGIFEWKYYFEYDAIFVPICKSFLAFLLFSVIILLSSGKRPKKLDKAVVFLSIVSFEVYITHQFIELSVHKYVPLCSDGTLLSGLLMLTISVVLIALNTLALKIAEHIILKLLSKVKK